jgi:23S rRNA pseudouridine1911/1915/1917 synthase
MNEDIKTVDALSEAELSQEEDGAQHAFLIIKRQLPNRRIDKYIRHRFPDFSRAIIQKLITEQAVTVNGKSTKSSYNLKAGDRVDLILPPPATHEIVPEDIPLDIVHEDESLLVINKQEDLVVHPAKGIRGGTLVNGLAYYSNSLSTVNGQFRPGIVHRLDRNTTGIILVAKTDTAHWRLAHQFEHRLVEKIYFAIVQGTMELDADVIDIPLGRHPRIREKYAARTESGKNATTKYEVIEQFRGYALVRLSPKTGRTHQLRVHMSLIKHPIAGDTMYGGKAVTVDQLSNSQRSVDSGDGGDDTLFNHQALHARQITIRHPDSAERVTYEAPLSDRFARMLDLLRQYRRV